MGVTNPKGEEYYIAAAFPSACGKTNMAMLEPGLPGWDVKCVGKYKYKLGMNILCFFICYYKHLFLQCFDAVGWTAGRASGL